MKSKRKRVNYSKHRCPYCGSPIVYRSSDGIYKSNTNRTMLYVCSKYPACNAYVRVHRGTNVPAGELADPELRRLRRHAHEVFDQLHEKGIMSKQGAYRWLSQLTCTPQERAHIGYMGNYNCELIIRESQKILDSQSDHLKSERRPLHDSVR